MWTKTLRRNTNLSPQLVARALKNLEQRLLVKSIKGVQNATKKLYMLHDLEPAKELTGGAWCARTAALRCRSTRPRRLAVHHARRSMRRHTALAGAGSECPCRSSCGWALRSSASIVRFFHVQPVSRRSCSM